MKIMTAVKLIATLVVLGVLGFTAMLTWHVKVEPLGGFFEKIIPSMVGQARKPDDSVIAQAMKPSELPDVDPGERSYKRAVELLAMGETAEAEKRLMALENSFPNSPSALMARRILSEINLDGLLSAQLTAGKQMVRVASGDSYLGIAARYQTTMENMLHLNSMLEMRGLRPGDELLVMPLNFRMVIDLRREVISMWDGGRFVCEYPILKIPTGAAQGGHSTVVDSKSALAESGGRVLPGGKGYAAATKVIQLKQPAVRIQGWDGEKDEPAGAILLAAPDMEELNLLTRKGNVVEFR